jgi:hypothetical protein
VINVIRRTFFALALALGVAAPLPAVDAGRANGTVTIDGTTVPLPFAVETRKDNLFDEKKRDLVVVLTDKQLSATRPDDEIGLSVKARRGELAVLALRFDGGTLVNVTVSHKNLNGLVILPGAWFQYTAGSKPGIGSLKLPTREFEGHSYALDVDFAAGTYTGPRQNVGPTGSSPSTAAPTATDRTPR